MKPSILSNYSYQGLKIITPSNKFLHFSRRGGGIQCGLIRINTEPWELQDPIIISHQIQDPIIISHQTMCIVFGIIKKRANSTEKICTLLF